jgi:RHS repeat-associated protein
VAMRENGTLFYLLGDHLGSTAITASSSGAFYSELRYKPFGETRYNGGATPTTYRFTGQRQDSYIKLYYMGARWYDDELGRFISPDTIVPQPGNPQDLNRFSYTRNNPLKYVDPSGHSCVYVDGHVDCSQASAVTSGNTLTVDANTSGAPNQLASPVPAAVLNIGIVAYDPSDAPIILPAWANQSPPSETEIKIWRAVMWAYGAVGAIGGAAVGAQNSGGADSYMAMPSGQAVLGDQNPQQLLNASLGTMAGTGGSWQPTGFASGKLEVHFTQHSKEWGPGNITMASYEKRAYSLLSTNIGGDILGFTTKGGWVFRYNQRTNELATAKPDGTIETLFRPRRGMEYYLEQVERYGE